MHPKVQALTLTPISPFFKSFPPIVLPADSRIRLETTLKEENLTPELLQKLQRLNDFAVSRGDTLAQLALRWVLQHEGVTSVIVGASKKEQLADNLHCVGGNKLSDEELLQIEKILS